MLFLLSHISLLLKRNGKMFQIFFKNIKVFKAFKNKKNKDNAYIYSIKKTHTE